MVRGEVVTTEKMNEVASTINSRSPLATLNRWSHQVMLLHQLASRFDDLRNHRR